MGGKALGTSPIDLACARVHEQVRAINDALRDENRGWSLEARLRQAWSPAEALKILGLVEVEIAVGAEADEIETIRALVDELAVAMKADDRLAVWHVASMLMEYAPEVSCQSPFCRRLMT